jgi:hypothetical protein
MTIKYLSGLLISLSLVFSHVAMANLNDADVAYEKGDYKTAFDEYIILANQGNADAQNSIGFMYNIGSGVAKDYQQALNWYRQAANQGHVIAQSNMGFMYENGHGVAKDYQQALNWYRKAANQGNVLAQVQLTILENKVINENEVNK